MIIEKIVSGGQSGSDRAGLDWAIDNGIDHGGYCPQGRRAEDGPISFKYVLEELSTPNYFHRTLENIRHSDGTVIFTLNPALTGGSKLTQELATQERIPFVHIHRDTKEPGMILREFCFGHMVSTLNVAGSRASKEPGIGGFVKMVLDEAFR